MKNSVSRIFACLVFGTALLSLGLGSAKADNRLKMKKHPAVYSYSVDSVSVLRSGDYVTVGLSIDLDSLKVKSTRAILFTPYLTNGKDSLVLPSVGVYGRQRYYYYLRQDNGTMISGKDEITFRADQMESMRVPYRTTASYSDWMTGCSLVLTSDEYACCGIGTKKDTQSLLDDAMYMPSYHYIRPAAEGPKNRSLAGKAYVDFRVNKTDIDPSYHRNAIELGKIRATIDSVRSDADVTVTKLWMKGYASPEGNYKHNDELARDRTQTISNYVRMLCSLDPSVVVTEHEAEDWGGFVQWLRDSSTLMTTTTEAILAIAEDGAMAPDAKEKMLRRKYPQETKYLISDVFPSLRRTEYRIEYSIRSFDDPVEILEKVKTEPGKLSLREFFIAANSLEPGSADFNRVFEVAAAMFPTNETANLNAANAALESGDRALAARHLEKSGDSGEAEYSRGIYAAQANDFASAVQHFEAAAEKGVPDAAEAAAIYRKYIGKNK